MPENKDKNSSNIFKKVVEAGEAFLEAQIYKAKNSMNLQPIESDFNFGKAVTKDRTYSIGAQGYHEKPGAVGYDHLKWMAIRSSVISAILKTRQNRVASFAKIANDINELGFKICLKNEEDYLKKLREELESGKDKGNQTEENRSSSLLSEIKKADVDESVNDEIAPADMSWIEAKDGDKDGDGSVEDDFDVLSPKDQERKLKALMEEKTSKKISALEEFILNCGELKDRPFETKKWNFEAFIRAFIWDSMVYDQVAVELVPKEAERVNDRLNIHHFYPVDGSTVRFSTPALKNMKNYQPLSGYDILYPEEELKYLEEETDAIELDEERLARNEYRWVQVVRGRIERAFTEDELAVGFRNPVTDIQANGYPISELELLVALVASHLQTEYYNRSYFQQGFSAKGILHIKANLNRAKLTDLRKQWNHMISGNRNSFQTPIMSGMDEVQWIPLTQNHNEMEFNLWLNYLIKMICAIYQIDPAEIGYGIKDEGRGGISGDNTTEKLQNSRDKGFIPLMRFVETFINKNIIAKLDPDFKFEWCGLETSDPMQRLEIQDKEGRLFKSVNEIREENGLSPIEGADDLILDNVYFQWFAQFHPEGQRKAQMDQENQMMQQQQEMDNSQNPEGSTDQQDYNTQEAQKESDHERQLEIMDKQHEQNKELAKDSNKNVKKSLQVEYYTLED